MSINVIFKKSAFKHKVTEEDIRWAFNTAKYDNLVEGFDNKYLLIGFNTKGNFIEVMYSDLGENTASGISCYEVQKRIAFIIATGGFMIDITEEEADALDEYFTKNLPKVNPGKGGITTRQGFRMVAIDRISEDYLLTLALATKKSPTELIGDMVRERLSTPSKDSAEQLVPVTTF
jgi:hypothetical protein